MTLHTIINDSGMSARPSFYSGRGAITCDLNNMILGKLYEGIKKTFGDEAAKSFVCMVADIPVLSATEFLLALQRLEANDWVWRAGDANTSTKGIYAEDIGSAFGTIASVLGGMSDRDETEAIRGSFLRSHENELPPPIKKRLDTRRRNNRNVWGYGY